MHPLPANFPFLVVRGTKQLGIVEIAIQEARPFWKKLSNAQITPWPTPTRTRQ
jgi:hypothetical protein